MSRHPIELFLIFLAALAPMLQALANAGAPDLVVYAYDSFAAPGGLGPEVVPAFEKRCRCRVGLIPVGSAGQLVTRVQLDRKRKVEGAHVALGLDAFTLTEIREETLSWGKWRPENFKRIMSEARIADDFLPVDMGYFAWMADLEALAKRDGKALAAPKRLSDLLHPAFRRALLLEDPRTSTPGLAFLLYTEAVLGPKVSDFWKSLRSQWLTLTPGWDGAYGLFLKGEAPMVWSYTSSQAYHEEHGVKARYRALLFEEGQPLQVEGAVLLKGANKDPATLENARAFLEFLISDEVQKRVPLKNWMFPVVSPMELPMSFQKIERPRKIIRIRVSPEKLSHLLQDWNAWVQGVGP